VRQNTLIITITLIGLFVISLIVGYFAGERFFKPQASRPPDGVTRPETAPPTIQPPPAAVPTAGVGATPRAASTTAAPASPRPTTAPATPRPTPEPAATPVRATSTPAAPASVATPRAAPTPPPTAAAPGLVVLYKVQVGAFATRENAAERMTALKRHGFDPYAVRERGLFLVRVGAFRNRATAVELADRVRARGYEVVIVE